MSSEKRRLGVGRIGLLLPLTTTYTYHLGLLPRYHFYYYYYYYHTT